MSDKTLQSVEGTSGGSPRTRLHVVEDIQPGCKYPIDGLKLLKLRELALSREREITILIANKAYREGEVKRLAAENLSLKQRVDSFRTELNKMRRTAAALDRDNAGHVQESERYDRKILELEQMPGEIADALHEILDTTTDGQLRKRINNFCEALLRERRKPAGSFELDKNLLLALSL